MTQAMTLPVFFLLEKKGYKTTGISNDRTQAINTPKTLQVGDTKPNQSRTPTKGWVRAEMPWDPLFIPHKASVWGCSWWSGAAQASPVCPNRACTERTERMCRLEQLVATEKGSGRVDRHVS